MRKLSTIRTISNLSAIEGADRIEVAKVDGWEVVVGKGEFGAGEEVLYFEIDSMLPLDNELFSFLEPRGVKVVDGVKYHRLRTVKLRGQISQGLIMKIPEVIESPKHDVDYSEILGVIKYEQQLPMGNTNCKAWPDWIPHTDEERVQNLDKTAIEAILNDKDKFVATEKIDGTSCTIWSSIDLQGNVEYGVCSRNYGLEEDENNLYWRAARSKCLSYGGENNKRTPINYITSKCVEMYDNDKQAHTFVLQGEVYGEGIQNNPLNVEGQYIRFFNLIVDGEYQPISRLVENYPELMARWVPVFLCDLPSTIEEIVVQPDGVTSRVPEAKEDRQIEGFVWRHTEETFIKGAKKIDLSKVPEDKRELVEKSARYKDIRASFKAISNKYLLKHDG